MASRLSPVASDEAKHVFVSYVREDMAQVDKLCEALDAAQLPYWRDRTSLAPGDHWKQKIRDAIRSGALVFLACFSEQSRAKSKSYMNEEITLAVEEFRLLSPAATWLIPVRFDDGDIPEWNLGAGRTLSDLNYADLYGEKYPTEAVKLTTAISRIMGTSGPGAATVRASIEEARAAERPTMMHRMTKDMILDPAKRIELDDLISAETQHVLSAMRDEDRFPTQLLVSAPHEDHIVRCAEIADSYWRLAEPLCASLQVAARWGEGQGLTPWVSALRTIAAEAMKSKGGHTALLNLRHVPALIATFTSAHAAVGQGRWDNLKTLLVDVTFPTDYGQGREALTQVENPWTPFRDSDEILPNVIARAAEKGEDPRTAFAAFNTGQGRYRMPVAEWLHTILRERFIDQYPDDGMFDEAFDRTEVILGLVSQDLRNLEAAAAPEQAWLTRSDWFGRSTWRSRYKAGALNAITSEIESQRTSWTPLGSGLFGGQLDRVTAALKNYTETFNTLSRRYF